MDSPPNHKSTTTILFFYKSTCKNRKRSAIYCVCVCVCLGAYKNAFQIDFGQVWELVVVQYEASKLGYIVAGVAFSGEEEIPGFVLWKSLQPVY